MDTVILVLISILYIFGAYFFFVKKNYMGTNSFRLRLLCFLFSPVMVLGLVYELLEDWIKGHVNTRTQ